MEAFGINLVSITIYTILFVILYFVLNKFLIKKLIQIMEERQEQIDRGLKLTTKVEERLDEIEKDYQERMNEASTKVKGILEEAKVQSSKLRNEEMKKAQEEAANLVEKTKKQLELEKEKIRAEVKGDVSELVADAIKSVMKTELGDDVKKKIASDVIDKL